MAIPCCLRRKFVAWLRATDCGRSGHRAGGTISPEGVAQTATKPIIMVMF
jgi:hypothetical protein